MAASSTPHFCNDHGIEQIRVGAKELQCMGARPPFDHPHVYLDMGIDQQIICPYCSTLYVFDGMLGPDQSVPEGCLYVHKSEAA